jgi:hypothetical protein
VSDYEKCPYCGAEVFVRCRCPRADSLCTNGHEWHTCLAHDRTVAGPADHAADTFVCSCPEQESRHA